MKPGTRTLVILATVGMALGCSSGSEPTHPLPQVTALLPDTGSEGIGPLRIGLSGNGFVAQSQVLWNGVARPTEYVSATSLIVQLTTADLTAGADVLISVHSPTPGGGVSGTVPFHVWPIVAPAPALTSLSPDHVVVGTPTVTVRLLGTDFLPRSMVFIDGNVFKPIFISRTALDIVLTATQLNSVALRRISVLTFGPGGGNSSPMTFTVENPRPSISGIDVASIQAGGNGVAIVVSGSGFLSTSVVKVAGVPRATKAISDTKLSAKLLDTDVQQPGAVSITVENPTPGGGASNAGTIPVVTQAPSNITLPSESAIRGRANTSIAVDGVGFVAGVVVSVNGQDRSTTYIAGNRLRVALTAGDVASTGVLSLAVRNPGTAGAPPVSLTVRNAPAATLNSVLSIAGQAMDVLYDPRTARLYAGMRSGPYIGQLIAIDPTTGAVTAKIAIDEPGRMEMTSDGAYLYVVSETPRISRTSQIVRVKLSTFQRDIQFSVPSAVWDLQTIRNSPLSVIAETYNGIWVYDNGVKRGPSSEITGETLLIPSRDSTVFYATAQFSTGVAILGLDAIGVTYIGSTSGEFPGGATAAYAAGRLYFSGGAALFSPPTNAAMVDADRLTTVGRFGGFGVEMGPDPALGRLYVLNVNTVTAYDLNTFETLGSVVVSPSTPFSLDLSYGRLAKWGTDGLVVYDLFNLYIIRTGLAAP